MCSSDLPELKSLCARAGFVVNGSSLTYRGVTVDLNRGGAVALLDLPGGGRCAIGLGKYTVFPSIGLARAAVFDQYGRFLAGETQPKITGDLTFRL